MPLLEQNVFLKMKYDGGGGGFTSSIQSMHSLARSGLNLACDCKERITIWNEKEEEEQEKQEKEEEKAEKETKFATTLIVLKRDTMLDDKSLNLTPQHQQCSVWHTMQGSKTIVKSKQSSNINSIKNYLLSCHSPNSTSLLPSWG